MNIQIFPDYPSLSVATAALLSHYIEKTPRAVICLASGHTPRGVFSLLVEQIRTGSLDISQCTFFALDEWIGISPEHNGSCIKMLRDDFFQHLPIHQQQFHYFDIFANDLKEECTRMNNLVSRLGGFDIMLLGVGTNGHLGMNEPGTSWDRYAHIADLAPETISTGQKYFEEKTLLEKGLTFGLRHIRECRLPIIMASGHAKADAMMKALTHPAHENIPASIVQQIPNAVVMLDESAASLLPSSGL